MENFISLCRSRRSIRKYTDQPVPKEAVKTAIFRALLRVLILWWISIAIST
ncbi:MAG: nitroreductase family protein, partial [Paludibacteraceae bacterium]|nr:nitroreductase family protein [Paludibacteraceae bacterium]